MRLRYVDQWTIQRIAHELSISERQIYRMRHAEEDLATILWSWYVEAQTAADAPEPSEPAYELDLLQTSLQTVDIRWLVLAGRSSIEGCSPSVGSISLSTCPRSR